jgi:predicted RecB family nuclease
LVMATKITRDAMESYLACHLKGHLKLQGEQGEKSDYEAVMSGRRDGRRRRAGEKLVAREHGGEVLRDIEISTSVLRRGAPLILDARIEDDSFSLRIDGLKRAEGKSRLGDFLYVPILFSPSEKLGREGRALMEMIGLLVGDLQGKQPDWGLLVRGEKLAVGKIHLRVGSRSARRQLQGIQGLLGSGSPPTLVLNDHCQVCEFRSRCHDQAVSDDNLSLLRGMGDKEIRGYARRGINTVTQLAHTFRPRRKGKRVERKGGRRHHALSALAIRDRRIYVFGTPEVPTGPVAIYLDLEGKPDEGFVYLVGMVIVHGEGEEHHSFWANSLEQESHIFGQCLDQIQRFDDFVVYSYGVYEKAFLTRMRKTTDR